MRELVSKLEGGCMSARFHLARARAAKSYRMAGQAQVQIAREFAYLFGGILPVSRGSWTCFQGGFDRLDGSLTGFYGC